MTDRIRSILEQLEQTREDLLALSDDIWLSIDHNDSQALEEGFAFKKQYNDKVAAFDVLSGELSALVQQFTAVQLDADEMNADSSTPRGRERKVHELDQHEPHGLEEDFTFKRPYGFQLERVAESNIKTWRRLYELFCRHLAERDPARFAGLSDDPRFITRRGNPIFSRHPQSLRSAMSLPGGLYAEVNLSANHLRDQMKSLLDAFEIDQQALRLYLRQDRDAAPELSL